MKKVLIGSLMVLLGFLLLANTFVLIQSSVPYAHAEDKYMAGNFNPSPICECPVKIGDCVCKIIVL